ncbi:MAG TPA: L-threonylcarbamoyladenylate synthase [Blastocatellia bacterium]|nr:L-threonylcarbamoyladenylate synthase [Blastocatellia bacterium]
MLTKLTRSPNVAARFIKSGEVVAFPTETVYGLGANVFNEAAIEKIFTAKGRPSDNPLIAHISDLSEMELLTSDVTAAAMKLIEAFFPGPLTLVLPKHKDVPKLATAGLETIGVRMPVHALARKFIRTCGVPLVAPSANLSGKPSPTTWQAVKADLDGRIACILQGKPTDVGLESTVVDCTEAEPILLRAGAITLEQLQTVIPAIRRAHPDATAPARSPGLKYKHYAPHAQVVIVAQTNAAVPARDAAFIGLHSPPNASGFQRLQLCANVKEYAQRLFHFFRDCDAIGVRVIYCEAVSETGLGLALMDRLRRAAQS